MDNAPKSRRDSCFIQDKFKTLKLRHVLCNEDFSERGEVLRVMKYFCLSCLSCLYPLLLLRGLALDSINLNISMGIALCRDKGGEQWLKMAVQNVIDRIANGMEKKRTKKKKKKKRQLFPPLLFLSDTHDHNTHTYVCTT